MRRLIYILLPLSFSIQSYAVDFHGKPHIYENTESKVRTYYGADSLLGLEDANGTKLTPAIYTEMGNYTWNDMIMVEVDDSLYGLIGINGKTLLPPVYSFIDRELWGHLTVEKEGKRWGMVYNGKTESFVEAPIVEEAQKSPVLYSLKKQYEEVGIIRNHANTQIAAGGISEFGYANVIDAFDSDGWGVGPCRDTLAYQIKKGDKYYILSIDNQKIITEGREYDFSNYTDSIHFVYNEDTLVVVDYNKQEVIDKMTLEWSREGKVSYVTVTNMKGETLTFQPPKFSQLKHLQSWWGDDKFFHDKFYWEYAICQHKRNKKNGVLKRCLDSYKSTYSSVAAEIIIPVKYEEINRLGDEHFFFYEVYTKSCGGLYSMEGDVVIPCGSEFCDFKINRIENYDGYKIEAWDSPYAFVGVFSLEKKRLIIPCEYKRIDLVEIDGNRYFKAKSRDNRYVYFTLAGEEVP